MKNILKLVCILLPWRLKRQVLIKFFKYELHPTSKIGLAWVFPEFLQMELNSKIDHFTVGIHLDKIIMKPYTKIGRSNWITGFPTNSSLKHFSHQSDRTSTLIIEEHSSISKNHHIDCTNLIKIGKFSTIAGYQTQLLTHSIDVYENRQDSKPIFIGDYTFIGTNSTILGGASLPSFCVLAAKSLLTKPFKEEWVIYGGIPAKK